MKIHGIAPPSFHSALSDAIREYPILLRAKHIRFLPHEDVLNGFAYGYVDISPSSIEIAIADDVTDKGELYRTLTHEAGHIYAFQRTGEKGREYRLRDAAETVKDHMNSIDIEL